MCYRENKGCTLGLYRFQREGNTDKYKKKKSQKTQTYTQRYGKPMILLIKTFYLGDNTHVVHVVSLTVNR